MFELKKILKPALAAAFLALAPIAASAATTFTVTGNTSGFTDETVLDGNIFTQALIVEDSLSVSVSSDGLDASSGGIGFNFSPIPLTANLIIDLNSSDFADFGDITVYLSATATVGGAFASALVDSDNEVIFSGLSEVSPFYVVFDWTNDNEGSFNADVSLSPVPVPAAGFLLLGALGGLGMMRRRRKAA